VKAPAEVVKLGQAVLVTVLEVDNERRRISLSLREPGAKQAPSRSQQARGGADGRPEPNRDGDAAGRTHPSRGAGRRPPRPVPGREAVAGTRSDHDGGKRPTQPGQARPSEKPGTSADSAKSRLDPNNPFVRALKGTRWPGS
jgi:hypothetical protein